MRSAVAAVKYERTYGQQNNKKSDQDKRVASNYNVCVGVTKTAQREGQRGEREKGNRHR